MAGSGAGWYLDPRDDTQARYYDGEAWTDRTRPLAETTRDASPGAAPPPPPDPAERVTPTTPAAEPRPDTGSDRPWWRHPVALIGAVVVVVIGVAGAVLLLSEGDEASAEVILEATDAEGDDPFMDSVATTRIAVSGGDVEQVTGGDRAVESVTGATPGLYGGTGDQAACDAEALVAFLDDNPAKARAFADIVGTTPDQIGDYVAGLTPVVLREDTRVTNHGYANDTATPFQAVLQAGTAVLVDQQGVPRVRCACGNPLAEPRSPDATIDFTGDPWDGFTPDRLVAVTGGQTIDRFEVIDLDTGEEVELAVGSAARSEITVEALLNAVVPFDNCDDSGTAQLQDGGFTCQGELGVGDTRSIWIIGSSSDPVGASAPEVHVGDVTGDGIDDGIILVRENFGGSGAFDDLVFFDGAAQPEAPLGPGQSIGGGAGNLAAELTAARIVDGVVEVDALDLGPRDGQNFPTVPSTLRFEWDGSALVPA